MCSLDLPLVTPSDRDQRVTPLPDLRGPRRTPHRREQQKGFHVYLPITGTRWMCGREVMTTNYEIIFPSEDRTHAPFRRDIAKAEMSGVVFGLAQAQYSKREAVNYMEESLL